MTAEYGTFITCNALRTLTIETLLYSCCSSFEAIDDDSCDGDTAGVIKYFSIIDMMKDINFCSLRAGAKYSTSSKIASSWIAPVPSYATKLSNMSNAKLVSSSYDKIGSTTEALRNLERC